MLSWKVPLKSACDTIGTISHLLKEDHSDDPAPDDPAAQIDANCNSSDLLDVSHKLLQPLYGKKNGRQQNEASEREEEVVEEPPVQAPPVQLPHVHFPPVQIPPVPVPRVRVPPVHAQPVEDPPVQAPPIQAPAAQVQLVQIEPGQVPADEFDIPPNIVRLSENKFYFLNPNNMIGILATAGTREMQDAVGFPKEIGEIEGDDEFKALVRDAAERVRAPPTTRRSKEWFINSMRKSSHEDFNFSNRARGPLQFNPATGRFERPQAPQAPEAPEAPQAAEDPQDPQPPEALQAPPIALIQEFIRAADPALFHLNHVESPPASPGGALQDYFFHMQPDPNGAIPNIQIDESAVPVEDSPKNKNQAEGFDCLDLCHTFHGLTETTEKNAEDKQKILKELFYHCQFYLRTAIAHAPDEIMHELIEIANTCFLINHAFSDTTNLTSFRNSAKIAHPIVVQVRAIVTKLL